MNKYYRALALIIFALTCSNGAIAQGIPVFDGANFANMLQQLSAWQQQLQAMQAQYNQLQSQYQALTGARGFGDLLANPLLQTALPADLQQAYAGLKSGNLAPAAQFARNQNMVYDCQNLTGTAYTNCKSQLNVNYQNQDMFNSAYKTAQQQSQRISDLQSQINLTQDPKAIAELQARIQTEGLSQQNAMLQAQLATQLAKNQVDLIQQQGTEATKKLFSGKKGFRDINW